MAAKPSQKQPLPQIVRPEPVLKALQASGLRDALNLINARLDSPFGPWPMTFAEADFGPTQAVRGRVEDMVRTAGWLLTFKRRREDGAGVYEVDLPHRLEGVPAVIPANDDETTGGAESATDRASTA